MSNFPPDAGHTPSAAEKAETLYQDYLAGGPDAAYRSLKTDYDASAGMCNRDQYFKEVAADLQASGHMPNIAIGWLKAEKDHLDQGHDGVIDKQDIIQAEANGGLDAIFGKVVLTQVPSPGDNKTFFDQIAQTKKAWTDSPDGIEDADLRKYSRQMHRAERHAYNQEETAKAAAPLFDNNAELLQALDTGPHGERNGFISRREMKNFLNEYKEHPGVGPYTAENAEYVNEVLHGQIGRIGNPPLHGFAVGRLERRAGVTAEELETPPTSCSTGVPPEAPPTKPLDTLPPTQGPEPRPKDGSPCDIALRTEAAAALKALAKPEAAEKAAAMAAAPAQARVHPDGCVDLEIRKHIDAVSRVQPGEGYNAVAARLLNIGEGQHRTPEEAQEIKLLGKQIERLNGEQSTYRLRTGVVLPVSANLDVLMTENPKLKAVVDSMRSSIVQNLE